MSKLLDVYESIDADRKERHASAADDLLYALRALMADIDRTDDRHQDERPFSALRAPTAALMRQAQDAIDKAEA